MMLGIEYDGVVAYDNRTIYLLTGDGRLLAYWRVSPGEFEDEIEGILAALDGGAVAEDGERLSLPHS